MLEKEQVTISLEGWSNTHNEPIVCVAATTSNGDTFPIDSIKTADEPHTAENLQKLAENAINKGVSDFGFKVVGSVTDNTGNVANLRRNLSMEENYKDVHMFGCGAHVLNLLAKDFKNKTICEKVMSIAKYFRNRHQPAAWLKEKLCKKLILPSEVRWNTIHDCLAVYLELWPCLMQIVEEYRNSFPNDIYNLITNMGLKRSIAE